MKIILTISNLFLGTSSRSEVSRPVILRIVSIREHIVVLSWPADLFLGIKGIEILTRGRVHQSDVGS